MPVSVCIELIPGEKNGSKRIIVTQMTKQQHLECHLTTLCNKIIYYNHSSSYSSIKYSRAG